MDLDDLVRINRVSVLQANAKLVQKGECWTWNQRLIKGPGSILTEGNILLLDFLFSHCKASDANIGIIANYFESFEKPLIGLTLISLLIHCS